MLEALLGEERKGVLEGSLAPTLLTEVVAEEGHHFRVVDGPVKMDMHVQGGEEKNSAVISVLVHTLHHPLCAPSDLASQLNQE